MCYQAETLSFHPMGACRIILLERPKGTFELVTNDIDTPTASTTLLRLFTHHSAGSMRDPTITKLDLSPTDSQLVGDFLGSLVCL